MCRAGKPRACASVRHSSVVTDERATLEDQRWPRARPAARGGVIGICGEAGLGKSRLVHGTIGEGGPGGSHKALFAAATGLGRTEFPTMHSPRRCATCSASPSARRREAACASGFGTVLGDLDAALAGRCRRVRLDGVACRPRRRSGWRWIRAQKRLAAREATLRLCRRVSAVTPLVLVFEDVHWIEQRQRGSAARGGRSSHARRPLLVVLTYRSEYDNSWLAAAGGTRLRMAPLARRGCAALTRRMVRRGTARDRAADRAADRARRRQSAVRRGMRARSCPERCAHEHWWRPNEDGRAAALCLLGDARGYPHAAVGARRNRLRASNGARPTVSPCCTPCR